MDVVMPKWNDKPWGRTCCMYYGHTSEAHYMEIAPGGYSSKHCHHVKFNEFFVIKGTLLVHFYEGKDSDKIIKTVTLRPGCKVQAPPKVWHRFEVSEGPVELIEVYWNDSIDPSDIDRVDLGGRKPV